MDPAMDPGSAQRAAAGGGPRPERRRVRHPVLLGVLVVVVALGVYLAASAVRLTRAVSRLQAGEAAVTLARSELTGTDLTDGRATAALRASAADFASASTMVHSGWLAPLTVVPFGGRQLRSVRALASAAAGVTASATTSLTAVQGILASPHQTPAARLDLVGRLAGQLAGLRAAVAHEDLGPTRGLVATLAAKRATFASDLAKLRAGLAKASAAATAAAHLLRGPATYLLLGANNAEMRAGSGMVLSVGTVTFDQGHLIPGVVVPSATLSAGQPAVPLGGDLAARWGFERPNQEWRNLALSPQLPLNAPVAAAMWEARAHQAVAGVICLDDAAFAGLLGVTGPVDVQGVRYDRSNAETQLLEAQYDGLSQFDPANDARHERLGQLAAAVFAGLEQPGLSVSGLARALDAASIGRHLMVWSADAGAEAGWQAAGVGGSVGPDDLLLAVMNQGANKLDPYQQVRAVLTTRPAGSGTAVTVTVQEHNAAPTTLSGYAGDGVPGPRLAYNGTMALDLPPGAGRVSQSGGATVAAGRDGTSTVLAASFSTVDGQTTTVTWTFVVLGRHGSLRVDPSARLPATSWTGPGGSFTDATSHLVAW